MPPIDKQQGACARLRNARDRGEIREILATNTLKYAKEFSCAIAAFGRVRDADGALEVFERMERQRVVPDLICYSAAIVACQKGEKWRAAIGLLNKMEERGIQPDLITFNSVISVCDKGLQWRLALEVLSKMRGRGTPPDVISYSTAISACAKAGRCRTALELLDEMQSRGLAPTAITYNSAISAAEKGGRPRMALGLLQEMRRAGVEPSSISFSTAIAACAHSDGAHGESACKLLHEMWERRLQVDHVTYNTVLQACAGEQWEFAIGLLDMMRTRGVHPDAITFTGAMHVCGKAGRWREALQLLEEMERRGVRPDVIAYSACISACEKGGEAAEAVGLLRQMPRAGLRPDQICYSAAISACAKGGKREADRAGSSERAAVSSPSKKSEAPWWRTALDLFDEVPPWPCAHHRRPCLHVRSCWGLSGCAPALDHSRVRLSYLLSYLPCASPTAVRLSDRCAPCGHDLACTPTRRLSMRARWAGGATTRFGCWTRWPTTGCVRTPSPTTPCSVDWSWPARKMTSPAEVKVTRGRAGPARAREASLMRASRGGRRCVCSSGWGATVWRPIPRPSTDACWRA